MASIVNDYFKRFYPNPIDAEKMEYRSMGSFGGFEYCDRTISTIFPEIVCADGLTLSVQGHFGAYSYPRDDFADEYSEVEVMCRPDADELFATYGRSPDIVGGNVIWPYVPVEIVEAVIARHGGLAGA